MAKRNFMIAFALIISFSLILGGCRSETKYVDTSTGNQAVVQNKAADDFNLPAVLALFKTVKDAPSLEAAINDPNNPMHRLDLDADGRLDYVNVTEFVSNGTKNLSFTTQVNGETQELATITAQQVGNQANVVIAGNPQIYGANHYHEAHMSLGEAMFLAWLFSPRPVLYHPAVYGYPVGYGYYRPMAFGAYNNRMQTVSRTVTTTRTTTTRIPQPAAGANPNAGKSATGIKAGLAQPSAAQQTFQRNAGITDNQRSFDANAKGVNKPVSGGGGIFDQADKNRNRGAQTGNVNTNPQVNKQPAAPASGGIFDRKPAASSPQSNPPRPSSPPPPSKQLGGGGGIKVGGKRR